MSLYFELSYGSLNKKGEELCGDKVEIAKHGDDTTMVLADGLGSGVKANILASLTSKIVSSMLKEGAEVSDIIDTMASTLPVCKVRKVAYSTFTFLQTDPAGHAYIVESENPEIVFLRGGKSTDLPVYEHTISGKVIREIRTQLRENDYIIMFSDGVIHAGVGQLMNLGWQWENVVEYLEGAYEKNMTAYELQQKLLSACNSLYMEQPGDDTTVAVCRVRKPNVAYVMVGPPVDPGEDEKTVRELLNFDGTKIVCGGTTSQIVSKYSGKELTTCLNYLSPDVPPIGKMEGIDLVTEGVITLGKTLDVIKRYENGSEGRKNALNYKKDGAHLLAQTLITQCTGAKFVVGRAMNPAHQNPDLPLNLSLKLRLVQDIADALQRLGKKVEVIYH